MHKFELKHWEIGLMLFAVILFCIAAFAYIVEIPLRNLVLTPEAEGVRNSVGKVMSKKGELRREIHGDPEFRKVELLDPIYDRDTVVTSTNASAIIELDGGASIELGASSMVQIRFDNQWSLSGISRHAAVQVVSGKVTGRTKNAALVIRTAKEVVAIAKNTARELKPEPLVIRAPVQVVPPPVPVAVAVVLPSPSPSPKRPSPSPSPSPSPAITISPSPSPIPSPSPSLAPALVSKLLLLSPKPKTKYQPDLTIENGILKPGKEIPIHWVVSPPEAKVRMVVRDADGTSITEQVIAAQNGNVRTQVHLQKPGTFRIELVDSDADAGIAKKVISEFTLTSELKKLQVLDPLVGGEKASSNQLVGKRLKDFDVKLRWTALPGIEQYQIAFRNSAKGERVLERTVKGTEYLLNRDRVFSGRIYYEIGTTTENGFQVSSETQAFVFDFLPPQITLPKAQAVFTAGSGNNGILIVWQKTNFTDRYEYQISRTADFKEIFVSEIRPENFYILRDAPIGKIYVRVRSLANQYSSAFSRPLEFTTVAPVGVMVLPSPAVSGN